MCVYMWLCIYRNWKRMSEPQETEWQAIMSCMICVLEPNLTSGRAVLTPNNRASFTVLQFSSLRGIFSPTILLASSQEMAHILPNNVAYLTIRAPVRHHRYSLLFKQEHFICIMWDVVYKYPLQVSPSWREHMVLPTPCTSCGKPSTSVLNYSNLRAPIT